MNRQLDVAERGERLAGREAWEQLTAGLPVSERRLQLAGVSTAVLEGGEGPPVVLLHGPSGHAAHWMAVIPDLVESHRVVVPDLPGHGASELTDGRSGRRPRARLARRAGRAHLRVAAGAGGLRAGRRDRGPLRGRPTPTGSSRLVLVDTFGLLPVRSGTGLRARRCRLSRPSRPSAPTTAALAALRARPGRPARADGRPVGAVRGVQPRPRPHARSTDGRLGALMEEFGFPAIRLAALDRITVPTTLIWGRHDLATRLEVAVQASRGLRMAIARDRGLRSTNPPSSSPRRS